MDNKIKEIFNAAQTSEKFNIYSGIRNPRRSFSIKVIALYSIVILLLTASAAIFASTIKTAFFSSPKETESSHTNLEKIKSTSDYNEYIKVENVTDEIASLFDVPTGVKILEINRDAPIFNGLKLHDIIVKISGTPIDSIDDMEEILPKLDKDMLVIFTVYRNGFYKDINPYEAYE